MIVDDLDTVCTVLMPHKADPPLIVDPNAVLSLPPSLERLQAIAGRLLQRVQTGSGMQLAKLAAGGPLNVVRESRRGLVIEDALRLPAPE